jgi:hypothetical protein
MLEKPTHDHELKTVPAYFDPVYRGVKTFEVRRDDRGFQKGDVIWLREFNPNARTPQQQYTGRSMLATISWILTGGQMGIEPGYVVMSIDVQGAD